MDVFGAGIGFVLRLVRAGIARRSGRSPTCTRASSELIIWAVSSPPQSQVFALVGTLFILPFILGYTVWSYYVFRGKVKMGEGYH